MWAVLAPLIPPNPQLAWHDGPPPVIIAANRWGFTRYVYTGDFQDYTILQDYAETLRRCTPSFLSDPQLEQTPVMEETPGMRRRGRPRTSPRLLLDGILWKLATGQPWPSLPAGFPPWRLCQRYYRRLFRSGRWYTLVLALYNHFRFHSSADISTLLADGVFRTTPSQKITIQPHLPLNWENCTALFFLQVGRLAWSRLDLVHKQTHPNFPLRPVFKGSAASHPGLSLPPRLPPPAHFRRFSQESGRISPGKAYNQPMNDLTQLSQDYSRIAHAIRYIEANVHRQPGLNELAAQVGLSEYHFQRLFTRWAGISPKRFLQFLTRENAKALLAASGDLLEATYAAGLSSPGRLYDLFVHTEAVTPGEYKTRGAGVAIAFGFHPSPFGECLLALTERGICFLSFVDSSRSSALEQLQHAWPNASLAEAPDRTAPVVDHIFSPASASPLPLHLRGTNFQIKVWEALLRLPPGRVTTYQALADQIHASGAARAVGNAVAHNPVAYLIPCHRVLQKVGAFGNYRYGSARKKAILFWENVGRAAGAWLAPR